jgi:hypothetical protein
MKVYNCLVKLPSYSVLLHRAWNMYRVLYTYVFNETTETWLSWIRASWYNHKNNQQHALYKLIYYSKSALHVSGDVFAHHQEHFTVFTVSDSANLSCCRLVSQMIWNTFGTPAASNLGEHYQTLEIQSSAPDDGRKTSPETCRAD